jgi:hypothetical protein
MRIKPIEETIAEQEYPLPGDGDTKTTILQINCRGAFGHGWRSNPNKYTKEDILNLLKHMNECGFCAEPDIWTVYGIVGNLSNEEGEFEYTNEEIFDNWLKNYNNKI